ncbi:CAAX prenyl protease 2-like protein [Trifolium pratense]|uniref:intramembrane prenyl-peptidase Rce1 n=1 Tax=Trifolium pratense TaxID=57577 RepID=A0A2K3PFQ3_TRIPR|nr:CAAX prenyl protease 2-like protein [Trifolium pratense]
MSIPPPLGLQHPQQAFSMDLQNDGVSKPISVIACISLALLYVVTLYAPTFLLRLPPPSSFTNFMIRRFLCALISTTLSLFITPFILPAQTRDLTYILGVYGIRVDRMWQALVLPLSLTSLLYAGSLLLKSLQLFDFWRQHGIFGGGLSFNSFKCAATSVIDWLSEISSNIMTWRNYIVGPLTEELVFRACMIPILLCGGFKPYNTMILCPIFFSLASDEEFDAYASQFSGEVPAGIWGLFQVYLLEHAHKSFSGFISETIAGVEYLSMLILLKNNFSGTVPDEVRWFENHVKIFADDIMFIVSLLDSFNESWPA